MTSTLDALKQCMMAYEVDVTESEMIEYCHAVSTENVATTFPAALGILLDSGAIVYEPEYNTYELGFA